MKHLIQYTVVRPFVPRPPTFHICCKSAGLQANYKSQLGRPEYEARISPLNEGMIRGWLLHLSLSAGKTYNKVGGSWSQYLIILMNTKPQQ